MNKEKQIEEMAKVIEQRCNRDCIPSCDECIAQTLYNAGYRKQNKGEWKLGKGGVMYSCSRCNYKAHPREAEEWNFCPRCGSDMRKEDEGK